MKEVSTKTTITLNTLSQFIARVFTSGTTFILTILLARSLGTDGYGDFSKVTTYVSFFYLFADFGLNAAYLQLKEEDGRFTIRHLVGTRIILSFLLLFLSLSILSFFPQESTHGYTTLVRLGIILYSGSIVAQSIITTVNAVFQEKLRYDLSMIATLAGSIVRLAITYLFGTGSLLGAVICFLVGSAVTALFSFLLVRSQVERLTPSFSFSHITRLLKTGLPLGITLVFNLIYFRIDTIILTLTQPTQDVGIYNLSYSFFEFALVIPVFFMNSLYPFFLKRKNESQEAFYALAKKSGGVLFLSSLIIMAVFWIAAPMITMIKPEFSPGIDVLRVLSFSIPFFFITSLTMWMLVIMKKRKVLVGIYGCSMILNIVANIVFIPRFGYMAAAWITFLGEAFVLIISCLFLMKEGRQNLQLRRILTP